MFYNYFIRLTNKDSNKSEQVQSFSDLCIIHFDRREVERYITKKYHQFSFEMHRSIHPSI